MEEKLYEDIRYELKDLKTALLVGTYETHEQDLCNEHLDELEALCATYGFDVIEKSACPLRKIDAGTYLGSGKVEELAELSREKNADVVIFDDEISPNQQRNLEKMFKRPVIDRTELILEVFAQRAHSREANLQIELAKLHYQLPRLKRLWTHLSRQSVSGKGYLKGAGERQIELDRRMIRKRISQLKKEIEEVRATRNVQRKARQRSGIPTFAIVGYTNVGKSTLLNALTEADILVEDKLFATLDTTTRRFVLPNHQEILLVDTVGFIRKIPHTLVAAFKSTLEEALYTDILIHLIDVNHPLAFEHAETTYEVLKELGAEDKPMITVLNKMDLCEDLSVVHKMRFKYKKTVPISAKNGEGFEDLSEKMMDAISLLRSTVQLKIPQKDYALVSEVMEHGKVIDLEYEENDVLLKVEIPKALESKLKPFEVA